MNVDSDFQTAPSVLYKYRRFDPNGNHLRLITHGDLWFASAKDFNDPFDTAFRYNFDGLHGEHGERWVRDAANRYQSHLSSEEREKFAIARLEQLRNNPEEIEKLHKYTLESNYEAWGICSLCISRDNLLLWAHYSEDHKGFCVGLSVDYLDSISRRLAPNHDLLDLHEVKYTPNVPNPNFFESMLNMEDTTYLTEFIATKSPHWSYEKEYRLVWWDRTHSVLRLSPEAFKEIILGCRISDKDTALIVEACRKYIPQAQLFQAVKHESQFAIVLEPIRN